MLLSFCFPEPFTCLMCLSEGAARVEGGEGRREERRRGGTEGGRKGGKGWREREGGKEGRDGRVHND